MQPRGEALEQVQFREPRTPLRGNAFDTIVCARQLIVDRAGRIRIVSEIDCEQCAITKRGALRERPQRGLERFDDVAGAADGGRLAATKRAGRDRVNLRREWLRVPQACHRREEWREQFAFRSALRRADDEGGEISTAVHRFGRAVRRPRAVRCHGDRVRGIAREEQCTGARRMIDALPADSGSVLPDHASLVRSNRASAFRTVPPTSKQRPLLLLCPSRFQRT